MGRFYPGLGQRHHPAFLAVVVTGGVNFIRDLGLC